MNLETILNEKLGPGKPFGPELVLTCPFCGKAEHFYFNLQKGLGHCFKCNFSCNEFQLLNILGENNAIGGQNRRVKTEEAGILEVEIQLPKFTHFLPRDTKLGKLAERFLASRNIPLEDARKFHFGICEGWSGHGQNFSGRLILPVYESGRPVFFQARALKGQKPKYLNLKNSKKSHFLFNLPQSAERIILVEGIFDTIASGGTAMFGKGLSSVQLKKLETADPEEIVILMDADARAEALCLARKLKSYGDWRVKLVFLSAGDPACYPRTFLEGVVEDGEEFTGRPDESLLSALF